MPKHVVYGENINTSLTDDPENIVTVQLGLHIGWTKGGNVVQVGVVARHPNLDSEADLPGYFADFDWPQMNRIIAGMREARDQAFGRPE